MESSPHDAEQKYMELNRLLMLKYINTIEPDEYYMAEMCKFSKSKFSKSKFANVRAQFANSLPAIKITHGAVDAIKGKIFTKTDEVPLAAAIQKLMKIHGLKFQIKDLTYKSIYQESSSDSQLKKIHGMHRLNSIQSRDYIESQV